MLTGSFSCGALSQDPLMVLRGKFKLLENDPRTPDTKNMSYHFDMVSTNGEMYHCYGYKIVDSSIAFDPMQCWKAATTLYVTLTRLRDNSVAGRGILHMSASNFRSEMASFPGTRAGATGRFLEYYAKQTARFFFAPFTALVGPAVPVKAYPSKDPPAETIQVVASDGVETTLRMWAPAGDAGPLSDVPILFVPGVAVDHNIFATPTIKLNAIEFFTRAGGACFCITPRIGKTAAAEDGWTTYDARLDIAAALHHITRRYHPGTKVYVVAHCAGSIALSIGLLDGTIPAGSIKGITASNVFMNPKFPWVNTLKACVSAPLSGLYGSLVGSWFSCISSPKDVVAQKIMDQALRFYPVGARKELCNSVVCHRTEMAFGRYVSVLRP